MDNFTQDLSIIQYNEKFGVITNKQIILKDSDKSKIYIDSIKKVKLIKNRVFYTNLIFLSITVMTSIIVYHYFEMHFAIKFLVLLFSLTTLIYTFAHKFYQYKIVIKLNNNELYTLKTNQIHRKSIKEFYYAIYQQIKNNKQVVYLSTMPQE